jgi:hypothetical protein
MRNGLSALTRFDVVFENDFKRTILFMTNDFDRNNKPAQVPFDRIPEQAMKI